MNEPTTTQTRPDRPLLDVTQPDVPVPVVTAAPTRITMSAFAPVSRAGLLAARALGRALPPSLLSVLATDLTRDLGVPVTLVVEAIRATEKVPAFASPGCFAWLEVDPGGTPWVLDVDLRLALTLSAMLSGAATAANPLLRDLSPVERAAMAYLCLRALDRCVDSASGVRLLGIFDAAPAEANVASSVRVDARLSAGDIHGRIAMLVPRAALHAPSWATRLDVALPGQLAGARCELGIELGHAMLPRSALAGLAVGDVVVCSRPAQGDALLRFPSARRGFSVKLERQAASTELRLVALVPAPEVSPMSESAPTGAELLSDVALPASVELGRVTLPAEELAALKPGDTLLLGRTLAQPLDLVVGGKVIARGELVDVEGELGFRVTSLR